MTDAGDQPARPGRIVTFYSFKGGTGRTMALANVAWILAANGKRVLIADWDLESPGLHRFFQPFLDQKISDKPGILDFIRRYEWAAVDAKIDPDALTSGSEESQRIAREKVAALVDEHVGHILDYAIPMNWQFPGEGFLHFLSCGRQKNGDYQTTLSALDWDTFYDNLHGGQFFDALREFMKQHYDYVLIDSRTGLSDIADICTVHLPDTVVDCFTLATQGIEGAGMIAEMIQKHTSPSRKIKIYPVPMRIDHAQTGKVDGGLAFARDKFKGLPADMSAEARDQYWATMEVPYRPSYAYEEMLATIGDPPGLPDGLLVSYERIAGWVTDGEITSLPPRQEWLRLRTKLLFSRSPEVGFSEVILDFGPEDQLWAEWIAAVLAGAGTMVRWGGEESLLPADAGVEKRTVAIVSNTNAFLARRRDAPTPPRQPDVLIMVTDSRPPSQFSEVLVVNLAGLSREQAVDRLTDRLKGRSLPERDPAIDDLRYPGGEGPQVLDVPARNANFTGRDKDLSQLREELHQRGKTVVLPKIVQGLGGVGKTQLALEYAHRFKADYDVIWWMHCGQPQYVDASVADLGQQLLEKFAIGVPEEGVVAEVVQQVRRLLGEGLEGRRWLLVYDNAEDIERISLLMPEGGGHVLITSRNSDWITNLESAKALALHLDVFEREESISHLRRRAPRIDRADAEKVADILGDMPLAVASAGALLASNKEMSVADYLRELDQQPELALDENNPLREYSPAAAKAWSLSLDYLQEKSRAAGRLLEICSVMAPDISLRLINSQAMADHLRALDPAISGGAMVARVVHEIDLLALIKLDNNAKQIQVHRVVQAVVRARMKEDAVETARRIVHQMLIEIRPRGDVDVDDPELWPVYRLIWPHLRPSRADWSDEARVRQLLIERVRYMWQREDLNPGRRRALEIQAAWEGMLAGEHDPEAAASLRSQLLRLRFNLANILRDLAQFGESRQVDQEVLKGQRELLGDDHMHTLQTQGSLAADMRALGDYEAALTLDLETYRAWSSTYGEENPGTLSAAHNLALSHLLNGDFRSALAQDRMTLERRAAVLGPNHPRTFNSGASVARDLLEAGRYGEAAVRASAVLTHCRDTLGDSDRNTLNARVLLGVAQRCTGHPDQAAANIDSARVGLTRVVGKDNTEALACRLSQALNWVAEGKYAAAQESAREVLGVYQTRLGPDHPLRLICRLNLATMLCLEQDYLRAEAEARLAADGLEKRLNAVHPYTLAAKMVLASALASQGGGHLAAAAALEKMVTEQRERILGPEHPDTLRCQVNWLLTQHQQQVAGVDELRQAAINGLGALIGPGHPDVTTAAAGGRILCAIDPQPF